MVSKPFTLNATTLSIPKTPRRSTDILKKMIKMMTSTLSIPKTLRTKMSKKMIQMMVISKTEPRNLKKVNQMNQMNPKV